MRRSRSRTRLLGHPGERVSAIALGGWHLALPYVDEQLSFQLRYIGFTGHQDPHIHLHTLEVARERGVSLDTVQMSLNVTDAHYRSFEKLVLPERVKQNIAVLGLKSMGNGIILKSPTVTPVECLHYALNLPTSVVLTGCDTMEVLEQALEAARTFRPLTAGQVQAILGKTTAAASHGEFELVKTSSMFDSTATHPDWLGGESRHIKEMMSA